jgi:hypothetical protein
MAEPADLVRVSGKQLSGWRIGGKSLAESVIRACKHQVAFVKSADSNLLFVLLGSKTADDAPAPLPGGARVGSAIKPAAKQRPTSGTAATGANPSDSPKGGDARSTAAVHLFAIPALRFDVSTVSALAFEAAELANPATQKAYASIAAADVSALPSTSKDGELESGRLASAGSARPQSGERKPDRVQGKPGPSPSPTRDKVGGVPPSSGGNNETPLPPALGVRAAALQSAIQRAWADIQALVSPSSPVAAATEQIMSPRYETAAGSRQKASIEAFEISSSGIDAGDDTDEESVTQATQFGPVADATIVHAASFTKALARVLRGGSAKNMALLANFSALFGVNDT